MADDFLTVDEHDRRRIVHAAGILDGLRTVAALVEAAHNEAPVDRVPDPHNLACVAYDIVSCCDAHEDNLPAAVDKLTDGQKITAYLWAAYDLLLLALHDCGEDEAIGDVADCVAQLARMDRP